MSDGACSWRPPGRTRHHAVRCSSRSDVAAAVGTGVDHEPPPMGHNIHMTVEVVHWNPPRSHIRGRFGRHLRTSRRVNNFGDLLGPIIVEKLSEHPIRRGAEPRTRLLTVGSIMHFSEPGDVIWGTGINGKVADPTGAAPRLDVRAVRGPLTASALKDVGTKVPDVYGDPALLWPGLWPKEFYLGTASFREVRVVPNLHDWPRFRTDSRAINPCNANVHLVIAQIVNSSFIAASSLHGLIIAESFGIPARALLAGTESDVKYQDYYLGTGRDGFRPARTVEEAIALGGEPSIRWSANSLIKAFPYDLWHD